MKLDMFCSTINQILEFSSQLFQNGLQYRTKNSYRSAISAFHDLIQGKPLVELVFLIVDLHNQGTALFGMHRQ